MITIEQDLQELMPSYNELRYVVSSDNTAQDNFKFVCDIYIDGTYTKRLKRPSHPDFASALFDVHRIVESFVTHDINMTATDGFYQNTNSYCKLQCKFGEEYGLDSSGVTVYPDLETSSAVYTFNSAVDSLDFTAWQGTNYLLGADTSLFIHSFDIFYDGMRGSFIRRNQSFNLYMVNYSTNNVDKLVIITYDSDRVMIDEYQIDNPYVAVSNDDSRFLRCAIGYNANDIAQIHLTTGTQPIFTEDVKYFKVYAINTGLNESSESLYFEISDECTVYDSYEVHWLDPLGGFNSFVFDNVHTEAISINRKEYKQQVGTMSASSFTVAKSDRGFQNYFTSSNSELKIKSGWINENIFEWLRYVKESPQVFINDGGTLIAVNVTDTNYQVMKKVNGNLINVELTLKYSVNNYRQRY